MSSTSLVEVKPDDEFENGDREFIEVNGVEVGVLQVEGEYYALQNHCLHDGGPVCTGDTGKKLIAEYEEPGKRVNREFDEDECIISCPWHGWSYELESGEHLANNDIVLPTYEVVVEDGTVYVGNKKS